MKLKNLKFRNLKHNEYNIFKNYYKKNLDNKNIFVKNKNTFDWHFKDRSKYNFFISIIKNKICSIQGYIPQSKYDLNLSNKQIFLSNFHSKKNILPGLGSVAFKKLISNKSFVGSTNFPIRMLEYHKKLGFNTGKMSHVFVINPNIKKFNILKINKNDQLKINKSKTNLNIRLDITFKLIKSINQIKIDKKIFKKFKPEKSKTFIKNRYLKYPYFDYYCYEIYKKNKPVSLLILRKVNKGKNNLFKIIDYFGEDKNLKYIANLLIHLFKEYKSESVDFYYYGIKEKFAKNSFFLNKNDFKNLIIPDWFNPFLKKNIDYHYAVKFSNKHNIRLFKGDGDRDRVN